MGSGYSHAVLTEGEKLLHFAGVMGTDMASGKLVDSDIVAQFRKALSNIAEVVGSAGGRPEDVVMLRIYCTDSAAYRSRLRDLGVAFRDVFGGYYPAMTYLEVKGLFDDAALVEIDGVAAVGE